MKRNIFNPSHHCKVWTHIFDFLKIAITPRTTGTTDLLRRETRSAAAVAEAAVASTTTTCPRRGKTADRCRPAGGRPAIPWTCRTASIAAPPSNCTRSQASSLIQTTASSRSTDDQPVTHRSSYYLCSGHLLTCVTPVKIEKKRWQISETKFFWLKYRTIKLDLCHSMMINERKIRDQGSIDAFEMIWFI